MHFEVWLFEPIFFMWCESENLDGIFEGDINDLLYFSYYDTVFSLLYCKIVIVIGSKRPNVKSIFDEKFAARDC